MPSIAANRGLAPEKLNRLVRRDLDWVVMKALEKDRTRRYETANGLARDIDRYLAGDPVEACPPSTGYRLRKFARKHRAALTTVAAFMAVLATATVISTWQATRARQALSKVQEQQRIAKHEAIMAEESTWLLEYVFSLADPSSEPNRSLSLREGVDRTTERLVSGALKEHVKTPESNVRARITLGKVYFNLGAYAQSRDLFADAHRIAREALGETHPTATTALDQLGKAHLSLEEFSEAERVLLEAYRLQRKAMGLEDRDIVHAYRLRLKASGPEDENIVHTYAKLGDLYWATGRLKEALKNVQDVLAVRRQLWGEEYEYTLVSMNGLGLVYRDLGRPEEALPLFEEAERIAKNTLGENHTSRLTYLHNMALILSEIGRGHEAQELFVECLARRQTVLGEDHPSTLITEHNLAGVLLDDRDYAGARDRLESVLKRMDGKFAEDHTLRGRVLVKLGRCLASLGERDDAERTLRESQALLSKKVGPAHKYTLDAAKALEELRGQEPRPPGESIAPSAAPRD